MPTHNAEPDTPAIIPASKPTEAKTVQCKSCGKAHEPIREFEDTDGNHVCSWVCLSVQIWQALYGTPCSPVFLKHIHENEAAYWQTYRHYTSGTN